MADGKHLPWGPGSQLSPGGGRYQASFPRKERQDGPLGRSEWRRRRARVGCPRPSPPGNGLDEARLRAGTRGRVLNPKEKPSLDGETQCYPGGGGHSAFREPGVFLFCFVF